MEEGGQTTFSPLSPEVPTTLMPSPPEPPQGKQCFLHFFDVLVSHLNMNVNRNFVQ